MIQLLALAFWLLASVASATIPNTVGWHALTGTRIDSVCDHAPCDGITTAWNSALYDTNRERLVLMNNGGHGDYNGNEIIAIDLDTEAISLVRAASSVSYSGNCTLADGTPRSFHSYTNHVYLPDQDEYLSLGGARAPDGFMQSCVWVYAPASSSYTFLANSPIDRSGGHWGSSVAWDGERHLVWATDLFSIFYFNPSTRVWTTPSQPGIGDPNGSDGDMSGVVDPVRDRYYQIGNGRLRYWDIKTTSTYSRVSPTLTNCTNVFNGAPGIAYDPTQDRIVIWNGGNTVYTLNPATHTCASTSVSGGPTAVSNGTYGRFQYSAKYHVFITCQSVSVNCYALRLTVQSAETDFSRRCNAPGVTQCESFDTIGDYTNGVKYFNGDGGFDGADMDTTVKASGTGALRFNLPAGRATSNISGDFRVCIRSPCTINGNDTTAPGFGFPSDFWMSWRIRISPTMVTNLANYWRAGGSRTGWKSVNLHNGAQGSCGALEITKTIDTSFNNNTQIWYKECSPGITTDASGNGNGGSPYFQQGNNTFSTTTNGFWCNWNNSATAGTGTGVGCFNWQWQSEWITFIEHYQIGANGAATSQLDAWIYREGSSTALQIMNVNGEPFGYGGNPTGQRTYNQVSFTPYMTGLSSSAPVDAFVWIDEFIVSTEQITPPGFATSGGGGGSPSAPINLRGTIRASGNIRF